MTYVLIALKLVAAAAGVASAVCWLRSATFLALASGKVGAEDFMVYQNPRGQRVSLIETAKGQSRWNRWAAIAAAIGAFAIAISMVLEAA